VLGFDLLGKNPPCRSNVEVGKNENLKVLVCLLFNWMLLIAKGPLLLAAPIMIVKVVKKHIGDPMRTYIAAALVIAFLVAVLPANSQQSQPNPSAQAPTEMAKPSPNSTQSDADKGKDSTVVFFREGHFTGAALKPSIYLDGKEMERLTNGHWFSVHAEPGKHQLQSSAKNEPATVIETVAGETTYVQMVILTGNWRGGGRLLQVDAGEAQKVIAKLKPLHD
jgi:hypothetical protein